MIPRPPRPESLPDQPLFQLGFAASLIAVAFHLGRALTMYELLKIVRRDVARFALLVILAGCAIQAVAAIFYIAPLAILTSTEFRLWRTASCSICLT